MHSRSGGSLDAKAPAPSHWTPSAEDDGGVESIEEIEVDEAPIRSEVSEPAARDSAPFLRTPVPSVPAYQSESSWNQSQGQAWSEDRPEIEPLAQAAQSQQSHWANAQPAELAEPEDDEDWLEDRAPAPAARVDGRAPRTESEAQRTSIAEMVVQTAEHVADAAHREVPQLPREDLLQVAREVIERIAWEVVPELAETIIQAELQRLLAEQRADS
jgi:hypothetical protein